MVHHTALSGGVWCVWAREKANTRTASEELWLAFPSSRHPARLLLRRARQPNTQLQARAAAMSKRGGLSELDKLLAGAQKRQARIKAADEAIHGKGASTEPIGDAASSTAAASSVAFDDDRQPTPSAEPTKAALPQMRRLRRRLPSPWPRHPPR